MDRRRLECPMLSLRRLDFIASAAPPDMVMSTDIGMLADIPPDAPPDRPSVAPPDIDMSADTSSDTPPDRPPDGTGRPGGDKTAAHTRRPCQKLTPALTCLRLGP